MKKLLNISLIIFVFLFIGIMNVKAATSSISEKAKDGSYTFTWNGVSNYSNCKLRFSNSEPMGPGDRSGSYLNKANGSVKIKPKGNNLIMTVTVYLDDPGSGNPEITKAEKTVGTPPTPAPTPAPTSSTTTTTQGNVQNSSYLKSITVKNKSDEEIKLTPEFNKNVFEYSATVESSIRTLNVSGVAESDKAVVTYSKEATEELVAGEENKITITVVAEDGSKREYILKIKRDALASDTSIKELIIKEVSGFKFDPEITKYTLKLDEDVDRLTIKCVPTDENASCSIEGNNKLQDKSIVRIIVTAPDETKTVYKFTISKEVKTTASTKKIKAGKNPLVVMGLSMIALGLVGGIIYVIRKKEIL